MIKYVIQLENQKIEFPSMQIAEAYVGENELDVEIQVIDDPAATTIKPKHYADLTPRQIRQVLVLNGIALESIDAMLAILPEPQKSLAQIEWEYSVAVKRHNPLVAQMASALGLSEAQVDAMWEYGLTL